MGKGSNNLLCRPWLVSKGILLVTRSISADLKAVPPWGWDKKRLVRSRLLLQRFFFFPFHPPSQSQPFRNILGLGLELGKLSSPSLKLLYVLRFDVTSGHGGEEVGGRGKHWRSFLSYLCIIKEHASWERGIKAPQALPWMTWLTAGPKAGLTVARRLGSNSPPTSGRARASPPAAPNLRPHSEHPLVLPGEEQSPAHSRVSWAEACALRTRQPALKDVLPSGKYRQEQCLERGAVITKCEAWPNDGVLMWGYCLKMENVSSSDFIKWAARHFLVLER